MLGAGGTCEFSAQTLRSDRRGAHVSPAAACASDPAAPPSGITHSSDDAASRMRTGKTHRLKTCATGGQRGAARAQEPALLGHRSAAGGLVGEARMAKRKKHRASEGQNAGSRAAPDDRKPEPTPGRRRRRDSHMAVASVRRRAWAAPSLIHARASRVSRKLWVSHELCGASVMRIRSAGFQPAAHSAQVDNLCYSPRDDQAQPRDATPSGPARRGHDGPAHGRRRWMRRPQAQLAGATMARRA